MRYNFDRRTEIYYLIGISDMEILHVGERYNLHNRKYLLASIVAPKEKMFVTIPA